MSMPDFPKPNRDYTQEQALTMILSSIASEEALSHIIKAEGDKLQYILNTSLLEMVMQNQMILKGKTEAVLDHLPSLSLSDRAALLPGTALPPP